MKALGNKVEGKYTYTPSLLEKEERSINRKTLEIDRVTPFYGFDIWNCYEFSCLDMRGVPQYAILRIAYPASSKYIVESKSLKLYLNSFNMERLKGIETAISIIRADLQALLECRVLIKDFSVKDCEEESYLCIEKNIPYLEDLIPLSFKWEDDPILEPRGRFEFLEISNTCKEDLSIRSYSLRSNCKVTHQPDWGDLFIYIKGKMIPNLEGLFRYILSFRTENHFHEEIVETIYRDLFVKFEPEKLYVYAKYTRRGGIDINPHRFSDPNLFYSNIEGPFERTIRQ